jgi:solute:Na+ symporter, SSS family
VKTFTTLDSIVFVIYFILVLGLAYWVSRPKPGAEKNAEDYFLAGRSLTWWAIGTSTIAANISSEQIIGMSGSAFALGLGIASYEWLAALTLLIVAKFFLPIFLEKRIYTMPQFLLIRFDQRVSLSLAAFWVLLYVFVNLTTVLYLGALTLQVLLGVPLIYGIIGLAIGSAIFTIYGGLAAVAWTDVVQVCVLVFGGCLITYLGLQAIAPDANVITGFGELVARAPERFQMVFPANHPELPWTGVFFGGMWIANISYFACNQFITQRALAAKNLSEAKRGLLFAAFLKILLPFVIVTPGIIAYVLYPDLIPADQPDRSYATVVGQLVPSGMTGLIIAGLTAAILSTLNSVSNSASTIFTMDIVRSFTRRSLSERALVRIGRLSTAAFLVIACLVAPQLANFEQAFQFIQEYGGFLTPGVVAIFLFGLFWPRTTANAALAAIVLSIPLSVVFKFLLPAMPFLNRMAIVFLILSAIVVAVTLLQSCGRDPKAIEINPDTFNTDGTFNVTSIFACGILAALYLSFW